MTVLSALRETAGFFGERIAEKPGTAGGVTALAVAMTFFTANAVYFQERQHPAALFATRPELTEVKPRPEQPVREVVTAPSQPDETRFVPDQDTGAIGPVIPDVAPIPAKKPAMEMTVAAEEDKSDTSVAGIQELLAKLGYYDGDLDGLKGPKTDTAIQTYKKNAGLAGIDLSEDELMTSLRNNLGVTAAIPEARPDPVQPDVTQLVAELIASAANGQPPLPDRIPSAEVVRVQAALRAFGNTDIVVDGVPGGQTETAIREFQALFQLPVTGEIDGTLLDKMRAVGLIH